MYVYPFKTLFFVLLEKRYLRPTSFVRVKDRVEDVTPTNKIGLGLGCNCGAERTLQD